MSHATGRAGASASTVICAHRDVLLRLGDIVRVEGVERGPGGVDGERGEGLAVGGLARTAGSWPRAGDDVPGPCATFLRPGRGCACCGVSGSGAAPTLGALGGRSPSSCLISSRGVGRSSRGPFRGRSTSCATSTRRSRAWPVNSRWRGRRCDGRSSPSWNASPGMWPGSRQSPASASMNTSRTTATHGRRARRR